MRAAIVVPFRDRGDDPCRRSNLEKILHHWSFYWAPVLTVSDGRSGNTPFCRGAAYNRGAAITDADILIYTESDMLVPHDQIDAAVQLAAEQTGLVVPFTCQKKLSPQDSDLVRAGHVPDQYTPICSSTNNYGCVNIINRQTLHAIGQFDENFTGNAHDDTAMWHAFNTATTNPTRFIPGDAYHLYHREAIGAHTTAAEKAATSHNYRRMQLYLQATTPEQIRHLTAGGTTLTKNWKGQLC